MTNIDRKWQPMRINADGELSGGLFCAYCGEVNVPEAESCERCGKYIADQGPDLSARLRRIRRYASNVHQEIDEKRTADLIGSHQMERTGSGFSFLLFLVGLFRPSAIDDEAEGLIGGTGQEQVLQSAADDPLRPVRREVFRLAVGFIIGFLIGLIIALLLTR
jgi:hypothetical protein